MTPSEGSNLEFLIINSNTHARITYQLARQLGPLLPIVSLATVRAKLPQVLIDGRRLTLETFAPYIGVDLLPINTIDDLVKKLSVGVRFAIALARSASVRTTNPAVLSLLATSLQEEPGTQIAIPVVYHTGGPSLASSTHNKRAP
jgi:hypothetical protein